MTGFIVKKLPRELSSPAYQVHLFGDSITRGSFDTESSGWADRIKAEANIKTVNNELEPLITVYNMGIGGNNTNDLLKRFKFETEQRLVRDSEIYFLFSFGLKSQ